MKRIQILMALSFAFLCLIVCLVGSDLVKDMNTGYHDTDIDNTREYVPEEDKGPVVIWKFNQEDSPEPKKLTTECKVPTSDTVTQGGSCGP